MTVYFDYKNFISLFNSQTESEKYRNVIQFLKKQVDIHLNFATEELDDNEFILLTEFQEGRQEGWKSKSKFTHGKNEINPRPLSEDSFPSKSSLYLLDDKNVETLKEKNFVLIGGVNEEVDLLSSLNIDTDDYGFHVELEIGEKEFKDWNEIQKFVRPFSSLLFVDRFMFYGTEKRGKLSLFKYNIEVILNNYYKNKNSNSTLIFVYRVDPEAERPNNIEPGPDFELLKKKINSKIESIKKNCPLPEVVFIGVPRDEIKDEHDRHIISNYLRIKSGDSLIYYNYKGKIISKSSTIDFYSLGKRNYRENTSAIVSKINKIILETYDKYPKYCDVPDGINLKNLLKF